MKEIISKYPQVSVRNIYASIAALRLIKSDEEIENMKEAMKKSYKEFETLKDAMLYCGSKLKIPVKKYVKQGTLLNEMLHTKQTTLDQYFK